MADNYNGWANRETWALMLWIENDQGLSEWAREIAPGGETAVKEWVETLLTPHLYREEFGSEMSEELSMMASDVGSLWRIDWDEIMAHLTNEE